jgi:hypothetical protein
MANGYDHTQRGMLHYLVGLSGGLCLAGALVSGPGNPIFMVLVAAACLMMFIGACFVYLRIRDDGDRLSIRFGPVQTFGTSIRYENIAAVEPSRTTFLAGWGVHGLPFVGVVYNIHGYACVKVTFKRPHGLFRFRYMAIGTDDPEGLAAFLSGKARQAEADAEVRHG